MSEVPKSNQILEDRKGEKRTSQRDEAKKPLVSRNDGASYSFGGWGKKKSKEK